MNVGSSVTTMLFGRPIRTQPVAPAQANASQGAVMYDPTPLPQPPHHGGCPCCSPHRPIEPDHGLPGYGDDRVWDPYNPPLYG